MTEFLTQTKQEEAIQQNKRHRRRVHRDGGGSNAIDDGGAGYRLRPTKMILRPMVQVYLGSRWLKDPYLTAFMFQIGNAARNTQDENDATVRSMALYKNMFHLSLPMPCDAENKCKSTMANCTRRAICSGISFCYQHAIEELSIRIIKTKNIDSSDMIRFSAYAPNPTSVPLGQVFLRFVLRISERASETANITNLSEMSTFLLRSVGFSANEAQMIKDHNQYCNGDPNDIDVDDNGNIPTAYLPHGLMGMVSLLYLCGLFNGGNSASNVELIGHENVQGQDVFVGEEGQRYREFSVYVRATRPISNNERLVVGQYSGNICVFRPELRIPGTFYQQDQVMHRDHGEEIRQNRGDNYYAANMVAGTYPQAEVMFNRLVDGKLGSRIIWTVQRTREETPVGPQRDELRDNVQIVTSNDDTGNAGYEPPAR